MSAISTLPRQRLEDAVCLADTGTWGEDAGPGGGAPVLRSSNIQDGHLVLEDVAWRDVPGKHRESKLLVDGDLIVTMSSGSPAHIGKCCVFTQPFDNQPYYFSNFTLRLRAYPDVADPRWLFHWLSSPGGRAVLDAMNSTTSGLRNLNRKLYLAQKIPLPPLPEQRRIAAILDKADAVRRKRQQTLDLTDQFLRSAFLDMFGDPVTNPKGWPVIEFGELLSDISYGTSKKCTSERTVGTTPILRIPNILGGEISWDDLKHCALDARELDKLRLEDGDLLFVRTNGNPEYIARCAVFDGNDEPVAFASYLIRARFREGADALPVFLREQFSFPTYRSRLVRETRTTAGNFNISSKGLRRLRLVLPPMREQEQFFRAIEAIVRLRKKYATAQTSEEALLGSVTQRAFRGELSAPVGGKP